MYLALFFTKYIDLQVVRVLTEYLGFRVRVLKKWYSSTSAVLEYSITGRK